MSDVYSTWNEALESLSLATENVREARAAARINLWGYALVVMWVAIVTVGTASIFSISPLIVACGALHWAIIGALALWDRAKIRDAKTRFYSAADRVSALRLARN